jgi:hypothetical protein
MKDERRHATYGTPLSAWIKQIPAELPVDAVGLWQIIPQAREAFGLEGQELISLVERAIYALLEHGAKPVRGGMGTDHDWIEQTCSQNGAVGVTLIPLLAAFGSLCPNCSGRERKMLLLGHCLFPSLEGSFLLSSLCQSGKGRA